MGTQKDELRSVLEDTLTILDRSLHNHRAGLNFQEIGIISSVGSGIAGVIGLPDVRSEELILFPGNKLGIAFNLDAQEVAAVLLDHTDEIKAGQEVHLTGRVMDVPVGESLLGRVIDPLGRPLDELGKIEYSEKLPIEREAAGIMDRAPVNIPLQTGIQVIDALIPVGRGQRELILGDRQTGKTAIALDTI